MATTADPPPTLIFYEPPLLVDGGSAELAALAAASAMRAKKSAQSTLDDVVNSILPPRMWQQADGSSWMQYASKAPPSRPELAQLQAALDQRLQQRQAKATGLCAVRSELYSQLFGARRPPRGARAGPVFCPLAFQSHPLHLLPSPLRAQTSSYGR